MMHPGAGVDISSVEAMVGIPYREGGHPGEGYLDCFTCAAEAMRRMGLTMPPLQYRPDGTAEAAALEHFCRWFDRAPGDQLQRGALVLMTIRGRRRAHVGVAIDSRRIIHCGESTGVVIQRAQTLRPLIRGAFILRLTPREQADPSVLNLVAAPGIVAGLVPLILYALISTVISIGLSYAINALIGPPRVPKGENSEESPTYSWSGIRNTHTQGNPIPVIYGEHRVGGQVLELFRKNRTDSSLTEDLHMLIGVGYGVLNRIGNYDTDMDVLGPRGSMTDHFSASRADLQESGVNYPLWFRRWGSAGAIAPNGTVASKGSGSAGYSMRDDIGIDGKNVYASCAFASAASGGSYIALTVNLKDIDNYHAVYAEPDGGGGYRLKLIKRVASVETTLYTHTSYTLGQTVALWRYGEILHLEVNGSEVTTQDADPGNDWGYNGLVSIGAAGATVDDFVLRCAKYLPTGLQINGVEASSFPHIKGWIRMGRERQGSPGGLFSKIIQSYHPDILLGQAWTQYSFRATGDGVTGFHVNLDFPKGLYDQSGSSLATRSVVIEIEYRDNDAGTFAPITGSPFTITEKHTAPFTRTITYEPVSPLSGSSQQIRIRRQTDSDIIVGDSRIADDVRLADVNEVEGTIHNDAYDGIALIGLQIEATGKLSGQVPTITSLVRGLSCPTWDGAPDAGDSTHPILTAKYTQNPAWIVADILLNKQRGLGNWIGVDQIDWDSFKAWADWSDEELTYQEADHDPLDKTNETEAIGQTSAMFVINDDTEAAKFDVGDFVRIEFEDVTQILSKTVLGGGRTQYTIATPSLQAYDAGWTLYLLNLRPEVTDTRHVFNGVFDTPNQSAWDAIKQVCLMSRAVPMKQGNRIRVRFEEAADPVQHINDSNMIKDTFEISYQGSAQTTDLLEVQFLNEKINFDQDTRIAGGIPVQNLDHAPVRETVNLYGITAPRQVRREANFQLRARKLMTSKCKFELALDGLSAEPGDVISIASRLPDWTAWTGRANGTIAALTLSQPITLEAGVTYLALIRTPDDPAGTQVTITAAAGDYAVGATITTDGASTSITDAVISIGPSEQLTTEWRIIQTRITDHMSVQVECLRYNPAVYDLIGWTLGDLTVNPPPSSCIAPGNYFLEFDKGDSTPVFGPCDLSNQYPGLTCVITNFSAEVSVSGDGADCVTIFKVTENGIAFGISHAVECHGLSFCIDYTVSHGWKCCNFQSRIPDCIIPNVECRYSNEKCYDIC